MFVIVNALKFYYVMSCSINYTTLNYIFNTVPLPDVERFIQHEQLRKFPLVYFN